jgi:hypothetical protein
MHSRALGRKETAGPSCWQTGQRRLVRDSTETKSAEKVNLFSLGIRSPCLEPAKLASILRIMHCWEFPLIGKGKKIIILAWQKFSSHYSFFLNFIQIQVLSGLLLNFFPQQGGKQFRKACFPNSHGEFGVTAFLQSTSGSQREVYSQQGLPGLADTRTSRRTACIFGFSGGSLQVSEGPLSLGT